MKKYKSALITGGTKRIGGSIATHLIQKGYNVAVQYNKSKKELEKFEKELDSTNAKFMGFKFDFEKNKNLNVFFRNILEKFGKIDLLINNASIFDYDNLLDSSDYIFDRHINVNLKTPFFLSKYFVKGLGKREGIIINILDQRVKNITPYFTSYTISKVALSALTISLAISLSPKIRVNGISPGPTLKSKNQSPDQFRSQILRTPLKKQVNLSEINNAIDYIINNNSVTGEILTLDSGQSLGWAHSKSKKMKME